MFDGIMLLKVEKFISPEALWPSTKSYGSTMSLARPPCLLRYMFAKERKVTTHCAHSHLHLFADINLQSPPKINSSCTAIQTSCKIVCHKRSSAFAAALEDYYLFLIERDPIFKLASVGFMLVLLCIPRTNVARHSAKSGLY